jgi:hypothetical protein
MDFEKLLLLFGQAKKGDLKAVNSLIIHVNELRDLVQELSEGLEDEQLQQQVDEVLGHDVADEDEE